MTKAEERALEAYPVDICGYTVECRIGAKPQPQDWNEIRRTHFQEGYEQAEKDLALTWEDVQIIWMETEQYMKELRRIERTELSKFPSSSREIFEEILRRYKEVKK